MQYIVVLVLFVFVFVIAGVVVVVVVVSLLYSLFSFPLLTLSLLVVCYIKKKRRRRREENNGETRGSSSYTRRSIRMSRAHSGKSIIIVISLYNYIIYVLEIK